MDNTITMLSREILQAILLLFPGFLASLTVNALMVRKKTHTQLDKIFEALVFTVIIVTIYRYATDLPKKFEWLNRLYTPIPENEVLPITFINGSFEPDFGRLILLLSISILWAFLVVFLYRFGILIEIARKFRITKSTPERSVWHHVNSLTREGLNQYKYDLYALVEFDDGTSVYGYISHFNNNEEKPIFYLQNFIEADANTNDIHGNEINEDYDGILVDTSKNVKSVKIDRRTDRDEGTSLFKNGYINIRPKKQD